MQVTQEEYNVSQQTMRNIKITIKLLNKNLQTLDELQGVVTGGSLSINSSSGVRRSCNLSIFAKDSSFDIKEDGKIWLDKYLQIIISTQDNVTKEYVDTNMGIYVLTNPSQVYNATNNTINIQGLDLMCRLNGYMAGNLKGLSYTIKAGESVRAAITAILELNGITKYSVVEIPEKVPNDIVVDNTGNYFELLDKLCTILPNYQMYFDVDGMFIFEEIPINVNEISIADDDVLKDKIIDYSNTYGFSDIKNVITVIGKTHEVTLFDSDAVLSGNTYILDIAGITSYYDYLKIGFLTQTGYTNPSVNVAGLGVRPIRIGDGTTNVSILPNEYYVLSYREDGEYFEFYGEVEPKHTAVDLISSSPFNVFKLGIIDITLTGGDYDNIYTTDLARQRANWELYQATRMRVSNELSIVPVYWLNDVNKIISLTLPNEQGVEEELQYIVNDISFSFDTGGTQSLNISKYYPFYLENQNVYDNLYLECTVYGFTTRQGFASTSEMKDFITKYGTEFTGSLKAVRKNTGELEWDGYRFFATCNHVVSIDLSEFDTTHCTRANHMFLDCFNLESVIMDGNVFDLQYCTDNSYMFYRCGKLKNLDTSSWNLSNTRSTYAMFYECSELVNIDTNTWNLTNKITNTSYMFGRCSKLASLSTDTWDLSNVTNVSYMFFNCAELTSLGNGSWNLSNVINASAMLSGCKKLTTLDTTNWSFASAVNLEYVFWFCESLPVINTQNWNVNNVVTMHGMFGGCFKITELDVANWNISKVQSLYGAFARCGALTTLDVSRWDVSNVVFLNETFSECSNVAQLDVSQWNTAKVQNMSTLFTGCQKVTNLDVSNWNTSNCTNFYRTFENMDGLTTLDLSSFNTSKVVNMGRMFFSSLYTSLNLLSFDTSNVTRMENMFWNCTELTELDLSSFDTSKVTNSTGMFSFAGKVTTAYGRTQEDCNFFNNTTDKPANINFVVK